MRFGDFIIIIAAILIIAGVSVFLIRNTGGPTGVQVRSDNGIYIYSLEVDRTIEAEGPLGTTVIRIESGKCFVEFSPCPEQTCVHALPLTDPGNWNACLPNRVFISVQGSPEDDGIDAVSY